MLRFICLLLIVIFAPTNGLANVASIPSGVVALNADNGPAHALVVEKSTQKLFLVRYDGHFAQLARLACTTGKKVGTKEKEGDKKTPEGVYFFTRQIQERDLSNRYGSGAFPLDYPNFLDKLINRNGYSIWLHGINRELRSRDTNGCIAVTNTVLDYLKTYIQINQTPILIQKKLTYHTPKQAERQAEELKIFLREWNKSLNTGSYHQYLSFYDRGYLPDISWWRKWDRRKSPKTGQVTVGTPTVMRFNDTYTVLFDRTLVVGDRPAEIGSVKLFVERTDQGLKIVGEHYQTVEKRWPQKGQPLLAAWDQKGVPIDPRRQLRQMMDGWLAAWSAKQIKDYGQYYAHSFHSQGMNRNDWLKYKQKLNRKYKYIKVTGDRFAFDIGKSECRVTFRQHYESNVFKAVGKKRLILRQENGQWKIHREIYIES